jgi:uncharacterized protein
MQLVDLRLHAIGLLALRAPLAAVLVTLLVIAVGLTGLTRLTVDTSLTKLFHGDSLEYKKFERLLKSFPASEHQALVLVESNRLFEPDKLEAIREMHLAARLTPPVRAVTSIFSARQTFSGKGEPALIVPDELPTGTALAQLEQRLISNEMVGNFLLSPVTDGHQVTLLAISFDAQPDLADTRDQAITQLRELAREILSPARLKWSVGGVPVARVEMLAGIEHDFIFLNSAGFLIGILICALFFRRLNYVLISSLCPLAAAILSGGLIGLAGVKVNPLMTAIPLLIMAVTFTDGMHLLFALKAKLERGNKLNPAIAATITEVGPACVLASITTSVALFSLMLAQSPLVQTFGFWAAVSNLVSVLLLLLVLPVLALGLLRREGKQAGNDGTSSINQLATRLSRWLTSFVVGRPVIISAVSIALTIALALIFFNLSSTYRLSDQLPDRGDFRYVSQAVDKNLAGSNQIALVLERRANSAKPTIMGAELLALVHAIDEILREKLPDRKVISVMTMFDRSAAAVDYRIMHKRLRKLPRAAIQHVWNSEQTAAALYFQIKDLDASEVAAFARQVTNIVEPLGKNHPEFEITVTGLPVLLAREAPKIVKEINLALVSAFIIVLALFAIAFRSARISLISAVPNLLPVFAVGGLIFLVVGGLDYASVVGLTVAFGLAVDDTAHFLNRLLLERSKSEATLDAVSSTLEAIGPVIMITTVILMFALAISAFSEMPPTRTFGQTCVATLLAAVVADLIALPALILAFGLPSKHSASTSAKTD